MEKKMTFNYFYGTEADQFSFYRMLYYQLHVVRFEYLWRKSMYYFGFL